MPAAMMTDLGACVDEAGGVDAGGGGDMCPAACKRVFNGTMVGMQHCMEMGMGMADGMGSASMWEAAVEQVSASATGVSEAFVRKRRLQFAGEMEQVLSMVSTVSAVSQGCVSQHIGAVLTASRVVLVEQQGYHQIIESMRMIEHVGFVYIHVRTGSYNR